jgi:Sec23/Sec24 trunk domain
MDSICSCCIDSWPSSSYRPDSYFSQLGPDGRRIDVYERLELCRGAVEFVATSEYMVRCPTPLFFWSVTVIMQLSCLEACCPGTLCIPRHTAQSVVERVGTSESKPACMLQVQPPMLPTHLFLVDVSYAAIASGATAAVCSAIQQTLDSLPGAE